MTTHELKCWPLYFEKILDGSKRFEIRVADRDYKVGDQLHLKEYNVSTESYTGRNCTVEVLYLVNSDEMRGMGIEVIQGIVVMSIQLAHN